MSVDRKFQALVRDLDKATLEEVSRLVASEIAGRSAQGALGIEDIHPSMTAAEKEQVAMEIARVLEEQA